MKLKCIRFPAYPIQVSIFKSSLYILSEVRQTQTHISWEFFTQRDHIIETTPHWNFQIQQCNFEILLRQHT